MIVFVIALVAALIGVALIVGGRIVRDEDGSGAATGAGAGVLVIAAALLFFDSYTVVPTRTVAVEVSFGKPVTAVSNGWHWVAPWRSVEKFDASVQTLKLRRGDKDNPCATVRLANQTTACVDATVQWNIDANGDVIDLYKRYRTFDNIESNLVERQLQRALNVVFEAYNPLSALTGQGGATADGPGVSLDDLAAKATGILRSAVGGGVSIDNITIPLVHYDQITQDKLNAYSQALADTQIAAQRKKTADLIKQANDALAASNAVHDPGVQYQNCLNLIADLAAKGQLKDLPPTFNCTQNGSGAPVIVGK